ncbi:MAG: D-Ala-D-Ala dipeptidase [Alphaproteobacteria bacterium]|nr:D-Ala-D-Ala dipeptidase [Alphaproteobacteria bacterium]
MKTIPPEQLLPMDSFAGEYPVRIALDYARADNLLFGERIYRPDARLWLHKILAEVVLEASRLCHAAHGLLFVLHDGLRTVEAQQRMIETRRVRDNPHWLEEPRLLSPPGAGAHPRGMAIDVSLETEAGETVDMGTPFDFLAEDSSPEANPAHREHPFLSPLVRENRACLDASMRGAAEKLDIPLLPLPQEWWDFRLPREIYEQYAPLSDADLPEGMRVAARPSPL